MVGNTRILQGIRKRSALTVRRTQPMSVTIATLSQHAACFEPKVEIVPGGARKPGVELVIEPDLVVPPARFLERRQQDVLAIPHRHPACREDANDAPGKALDEFEHRLSLERDAPLANDHLLLALGIGD